MHHQRQTQREVLPSPPTPDKKYAHGKLSAIGSEMVVILHDVAAGNIKTFPERLIKMHRTLEAKVMKLSRHYFGGVVYKAIQTHLEWDFNGGPKL